MMVQRVQKCQLFHKLIYEFDMIPVEIVKLNMKTDTRVHLEDKLWKNRQLIFEKQQWSRT